MANSGLAILFWGHFFLSWVYLFSSVIQGVLFLAGIVNFLPGSWCSAVFWIWDENNVDNTLMVLVVTKQATTFQLLVLACQRVGWGCTGRWEGTQPGQPTPTDQRVIPFHMTPCLAYKAGGDIIYIKNIYII